MNTPRDTPWCQTARSAMRLLVGCIIFAVATFAFGYLAFMRHVDAARAWRAATRELRGSVLRSDETPERVAHVYQRRLSDYDRASAGVLAATRERLLYVGIEPQNRLQGEDVPLEILTDMFVNDTLLMMQRGRVYAFTATGIRVSRAGRHAVYAAERGYEGELDSLVAYVRAVQQSQRRIAADERVLRSRVAALLQQPLRYEVSRGDALSTIATMFGTLSDSLRRWNHLSSDRIRVHDTLLVKP